MEEWSQKETNYAKGGGWKKETTMHHSEPFTEVRVERKKKKDGVLYHVITYLKP